MGSSELPKTPSRFYQCFAMDPFGKWFVYSALRPSAELEFAYGLRSLSLRSSPISCNSKNVWRLNACYFDHCRRKIESSSKCLILVQRVKPLACKLLRTRLLQSGKFLKAPNEGILYNYKFCYNLFISYQWEKHNSPLSHQLTSLEAKGHISNGFGRWTFQEGNVTQVAQNFTRHFLSLKNVSFCWMSYYICWSFLEK